MAKSFSDIFQDGKNLGMTLETPQFDVSYNADPKSKSDSTATLGFKIVYGEVDPDMTDDGTSGNTAQAMNAVKTLAYQVLRDTNRLSLTLGGDITTGDIGQTLNLDKISVRPIAGTNIWDVSCQYKTRTSDSSSGSSDIGLKNFNFSTVGKTLHITHSLSTVTQSPGMEYGGFNFQQGIGFNDGEFAGVDVKRPNLVFQRDIWILEASLTWAIVAALADFTGSVNDDSFYGFDPGTVLFAGVSQGQRAQLRLGGTTIRYWNITLSFEVAPNEPITFAGETIMKNGWDYYWVFSVKTVLSSDAGKIVYRTPVQANIEQVYPYRMFKEFFGFGYNTGPVIDYDEAPFEG